jgi:FKBP-type peptidyl-prolyl cis-trans isomerase
VTRFLLLLAAASIACNAADQQLFPEPATADSPTSLPQQRTSAAPQLFPEPATANSLTTFPQRHSYAVGMKVGIEVRKSLDQLPCKLDIPVFLQAVGACLSNQPTALTPETAAKLLMDDLADKNKREGDRFLAANAQHEGVQTTPSGLQYRVMRPGNGPHPGPSDRVRINYVGALLDGTEFDTTRQRGPATYNLAGDNALLDGIAEGVRIMSTGAVYQLCVPPHLGFGEQGAMRLIGPNATLIFEVELLEISPQSTL